MQSEVDREKERERGTGDLDRRGEGEGKKIREAAAKYLPGSEMNRTLGANSSARFSLMTLVNRLNNSASEPYYECHSMDSISLRLLFSPLSSSMFNIPRIRHQCPPTPTQFQPS